MNCQKWRRIKCEGARKPILQRCHNPVLQPTCSAQMVKGVQCSDTEAAYSTEKSRLGQEISKDKLMDH